MTYSKTDTNQPARKTQVSPVRKCALITVALGIDNAAEVIKHLNEKEAEKVTTEIARLKNIPADMLTEVIEEFYQMMMANEYIVQGGIEYAKKILESALGKAKALDILNRIEAATEVSAFYLLQTVDDKQLLNFLQNEHPQTTALILANLKPPQAAAILSELPEDFQGEIAYRLATMEKTSPELVADIEAVIRDQIGTVFGGDLSSTGGAEAVAEILNSTSRAAEKNILEKLRDQNAELAQEITDLMFLFEDILTINEAGVQTLIKEIDSKTMALAMKAASNELKEKIFANMSERAAEMMREELQYLGAVRVRDVEESQKEILDVVHRLADEGKISLGRGEGEELIE